VSAFRELLVSHLEQTRQRTVLTVWRLQLLLLGYALQLFDHEPSKPGILFKQRQNAIGAFVVLVVFIALK
jgi:hypothetical protein